jgi:hypothetical protein
MSSSSPAAAAGAMGGKGAHACDSCLRRRARWYCAADDAFLCQVCDASVHSANPLARRHERLRPTSPPPHDEKVAASTSDKHVAPVWSKRKARSRRPHLKSVDHLLSRKLVVVPEVSAESSEERSKAEEDGGSEPEEEQLLYHRVPSYRALAELCSPAPVDDGAAAASSSCREREGVDGAVENANKQGPVSATPTTSSPVQQLSDSGLAGFGPTDAEFREFAADMEALLGQGMEDNNELDESFYMESLGLMTPVSEDDGGRVKTENDGALGFGRPEMKSCGDFNCCSPIAGGDEDVEDSSEEKATTSKGDHAADAHFLRRRSLDLRLNYEAVIASWGTSPWTDGQRPQVRLDDFWPHHAYRSSVRD